VNGADSYFRLTPRAIFFAILRGMNRNSKTRRAKPRCPLTTSPRKRAAANQLAAAVKDTLPPGLAQPALRAFATAGYARLDQFTKIREAELARLHGIGPKAIEIIRAALHKRGQAFVE
jgi:hypothetical protein